MDIRAYFQKQPDDQTNIQRYDLSEKSFYYPGHLPHNCRPLFQDLLSLKPSERSTVVMIGKQVTTPRYVAHYLRPYYYSGMVHDTEHVVDLPACLQPLLDWANSELQKGSFGRVPSGAKFNQALLNFYMDGLQYIGPHSDNEKQLLQGSPIFSASFGQTRTFRIRQKHDRSIVADCQMIDSTFLVMGGDMQKEYTHEVPKVISSRSLSMKPRVNGTFRCFQLKSHFIYKQSMYRQHKS